LLTAALSSLLEIKLGVTHRSPGENCVVISYTPDIGLIRQIECTPAGCGTVSNAEYIGTDIGCAKFARLLCII